METKERERKNWRLKHSTTKGKSTKEIEKLLQCSREKKRTEGDFLEIGEENVSGRRD